MKTFGIRSSVVLIIIMSTVVSSKLMAQCDPNLQVCNQDECSGVEIALAADPNNVFCQGKSVNLSIDQTKTSPLDSFIVYWCDGAITRHRGDQFMFSHTYNVPENKVCEKKKSDFLVTVIGKKSCSAGLSCRTISVSLTLNHEPRAKFNYSNSVCVDRLVNFSNTSCNVDESDPNAYKWDFGDGGMSTAKNPSHTYTSPGVYIIKLKVKNRCGEHEITQTITVVDYPDAVVKLSTSAQDSIVCVGDRVTLINRSNQWSNTKWTFPANTVLNDTARWKIVNIAKVVKGLNSTNRPLRLDSLATLDTLVFDVFQPGTYQFEMLSTNACGQKKWTWNLKVVAAPNVSLQNPPNFCETAELMPMLQTNTGDVTKYLWSFPGGTPSSFEGLNSPKIKYNTPGPYTYTLQVVAPCDTINLSKTFTIFSKSPISFINVPTKFCKSSSRDTLKANPSGGKWSGNGIIDADLGIFDPAIVNAGIHKITYTFGPTECQSIGTIDIEVVNASPVTTTNTILCINSPITQLEATPSTGNWSGNPAVDPLGNFDPAKSGVGIFNIDYRYNDPNGCVVDKKVEVNVEDFPTISGRDTVITCREGGVQSLQSLFGLDAIPAGGTFTYFINNTSIPAQIDPANYVIDSLTIRYEYTRNKCVVSDSANLVFIDRPNIVIIKDTVLCIDKPTLQLTTNTPGGIWSGQGVNPTTGLVTIANAKIGENVFTYTHSPNTTCEQRLSVKITIKDPGSTIVLGGDIAICDTGLSTYQLIGFSPSNGMWLGPNITASGLINVSLLKRDTAYNYTYKIIDVQASDCSASKSIAFRVNSLPQPLFSIAGTPCIGQQITLTADTTVQFETLRFTTSDGAQSSVSPFSHVFNNKGSYSISLEISDKNGCSNYITKSYYVTTKPSPSFTLTSDEGCAAFTVLTTNTSVGDSITFLWNVNNETYGTTDLPPINLDNITQDTQFVILLTATNLCGPVTFLDTVLVHPYPRVNFGVSDLEGCSPLEVSFSNTTLGNADTWKWDLGNGIISTDSLPLKQTYSTPKDSVSTYNVRLIATNKCGTDTLTKVITVYPPDITAFIESPGLSLCQYDTLVLTAFSTPGAINTWKLIAPDGTLSGASGDIALFDMSQAGTYTAILYASRCGSDTDTVVVTVLPAPFVDFDLPSFACEGSQVNFTNLGIGIGGVTWDYGDGNNDASGIHIYDTAGEFTVTLTAFSLVNNCPFSVSKTIRIIGLPTASFTPSVLSGCEPLEISFANNSNPGSNFDWDFGDMTSNSNDQNPRHTFLQDGTFQVKLTVYDSFGCFSDTSVLNIIVHPKPESRFSFPIQKYCHKYDSIPFTNLSTGSVGQEWIFENKSFITQNITWLPSDSGSFSVTLVAMSTFGCIDSSHSVIDILASPTSYFIVDNESGCEDLSVNFTNLSTATTQYIWDLKNGTSSVEKDLEYTFVNPGTYEVILISLTNNGCPSDTTSRTITVHSKPMADFDIQKDSVCGVPMFVNFVNNSIGNIDNVWSINGIATSQDPSFDNVFYTASTNDISLIVQNEFLCADTIRKTVDIYLQPIADFNVNGQACEGESIIIENNSTNAISYVWDIQNQGTTTVVEPELVFETSGTYSIKLIAVYNEFCKDTFSLATPIRIYESPTADFEYEGEYDDNILGEVRFSNLSIDYDRSLWNFGDGKFSDEDSPIHEYDINRNLLVTLTVYNDNGGQYTCIDSITKPVAPEWITTFFAPNALSPEYGDGDVKVFKPVGVGLAAFKISVYSPWGQAVWTSDKLENTSPSEVWDGTYENAIVPQGAYSWMADVTFVNGIRKVFKGSVTVVR